MKNTFILIGLVISVGVNAQAVLNGSFENNLYTSCAINESNASYSASMYNSSAFGSHNTIDVLDSLCYGTAQDGNWFLWLGTGSEGGTFDAISLELSTPLTIGNSYNISYYDTGDSNLVFSDGGTEIVEIGISTNDTTFGTLVYTSPFPIISVWTQRTFTFVASDTAKFITARTIPSIWPNGYGGTQIDNFSLITNTGINSNLSEYNIKLYPNPATELINIDLGELKDVSIKVYKVSGQMIYHKENINTPTYQFELNEAPGIYVVEVSSKGEKQHYKLIKN